MNDLIAIKNKRKLKLEDTNQEKIVKTDCKTDKLN